MSSVAGKTTPVTMSREPVTAVHQGSWEKGVTRVGRPHVPGLPVDTYLEIVIRSLHGARIDILAPSVTAIFLIDLL